MIPEQSLLTECVASLDFLGTHQFEQQKNQKIYCLVAMNINEKVTCESSGEIQATAELPNQVLCLEHVLCLEPMCKPKAREIPFWPYWGVQNEITVFPIDEGSNQECCHGNKMFYILEILSSCFISM